MKDEAQRIAIAEACGYKNQGKAKGVKALEDRWLVPNAVSHFVQTTELPDYPTDLNAMHEAEKSITHEPYQMAYFSNLVELTNGRKFPLVCATARQRAEAFLKTLGKWKAT